MFRDRKDAGRQLASALSRYRHQPVVVYALPRGGVVLGLEVARALEAPLDLIVVRKIGHPLSPEYAIGAVAEDGYVLTNPEETAMLDRNWLEQAVLEEWREARRRRAVFLGDRQPVEVKGKTAIVIDDGLATGLTMQAAIHEIRQRQPERIVIAVPVAADETVKKIEPYVDEIVVLYIPDGFFGSIGEYYADFRQVSDEEVMSLMQSVAPGIGSQSPESKIRT